MPIWDYECCDCGYTFENIEVWSHHRATKCRQCASTNIVRVIGTCQVRMDADLAIKSVPDPVPPLEELRGKSKTEKDGGYTDKPYADTNLNNYTRRKNKYGNWIWTEKKKQVFDMGRKK